MSEIKEVFFIFKDEYFLTKDETWSKDFNNAWIMSEGKASDTCCLYDEDAGCGSMPIENYKAKDIMFNGRIYTKTDRMHLTADYVEFGNKYYIAFEG